MSLRLLYADCLASLELFFLLELTVLWDHILIFWFLPTNEAGVIEATVGILNKNSYYSLTYIKCSY
jgi:hypothetical protein